MGGSGDEDWKGAKREGGAMNLTGETKPLLLRGREVAELLGVSTALAYQWMHLGIIPTLRMGRAVRCPRAALLKWIEQQTVPALERIPEEEK
jgi:excisionase family DNA binding protein